MCCKDEFYNQIIAKHERERRARIERAIAWHTCWDIELEIVLASEIELSA